MTCSEVSSYQHIDTETFVKRVKHSSVTHIIWMLRLTSWRKFEDQNQRSHFQLKTRPTFLHSFFFSVSKSIRIFAFLILLMLLKCLLKADLLFNQQLHPWMLSSLASSLRSCYYPGSFLLLIRITYIMFSYRRPRRPLLSSNRSPTVSHKISRLN